MAPGHMVRTPAKRSLKNRAFAVSSHLALFQVASEVEWVSRGQQLRPQSLSMVADGNDFAALLRDASFLHKQQAANPE